MGTSSTVNCEIPLNRYSFFEALEDKLLPDTYLNEVVERSGALRQQTENFRITNAISKPETCFSINNQHSNIESQTAFYFDLTKQKMDITDGVTKLAFHYELSGNTAADYNIYALVLHQREAELEQKGRKHLLRA